MLIAFEPVKVPTSLGKIPKFHEVDAPNPEIFIEKSRGMVTLWSRDRSRGQAITRQTRAWQRHLAPRLSTKRPQFPLPTQNSDVLRASRLCKRPSQHIKQEIYAQRAQTSADPEDPDFGLWTPGSEACSGSPPKLYHLVLEPCPTPPKKFVKIRSQICE